MLEQMLNDKNNFVEIKEAKKPFLLDIGGTPANVLEKNKINTIVKYTDTENIVCVVDPFDLSRAERSLVGSEYKGVPKRIRFKINEVQYTNLSSENVTAPDSESISELFSTNKSSILDAIYRNNNIYRKEEKNEMSARYDQLTEKVVLVSKESKNLREFMNSLIKILSPKDIKMIKLEKVLSENKASVYSILQQKEIPARVFCQKCGRISEEILTKDLEKTICCSNVKDIIESGLYVPEEGFLPTIIYLSNIDPCLRRDSEYGAKAINILKDLNKFKRPLIAFPDSASKRSMFESYILGENKNEA